jgi:hypothetical protein
LSCGVGESSVGEQDVKTYSIYSKDIVGQLC